MEVELSDPNLFDIAVFLVVGISTLFAFFKGFIKTFFSFLNWVLAGAAAIFLFPNASELLREYVSDERALRIIAYLSVFIVSFFVFMFINGRIVFMLRASRWGIMDRTLGFGFGLLRGAMLVSLVFFSLNIAFSMVNFKKPGRERAGPDWFVQAKTYQLLELTTEFFLSLLPAGISHELEITIENLSEVSSGEISSRTTKSDGISAREMKILKRVMLSLPRADLQALYKEYNQENGQLTDLERFSIYREIVGLYERAVAGGKVNKGEQVSEHDLKRLKGALGYEEYKELQNEIQDTFAKDQKDELGYKGKNIKQLDRLINNFDE